MAEEEKKATEEVVEETVTEATPAEAKEVKTEATAKAGKRSAKAVKEAEEKEVKEARKEAGDTSPLDPEADAAEKRGPVPITRSKLERRGKKYRKAAEAIDSTKAYNLKEALELAAKASTTKFDASVELHVRLGVDPRHADQNIRGTVALPHGTGKTVRVAVLAPADQQAAATKAGAELVGEEEILQLLDKEQLDFDVLIATPQLMAKLGKYARLLGPKGLMPNPKSGTVTTKVAEAVTQAKAGRIEFRIDKQSNVHQAFGKVSFSVNDLNDNAVAVLDALRAAKPASVKGSYLLNIAVTTTMGPAVTVDIATL
jgi:large subunit ribosomal protein L1